MRWVAGAVVPLLLLAGCAATDPEASEASSSLEGVEVKATASTGVIRGIVVDPGVVPIVGALVSLSGQTETVTTLENGAFGFAGLEPGTYFVNVERNGFAPGQTSTEVVAGVDEPPILRVLLEPNPATAAFIEAFSYIGYLECGVAVFATSVGCTIFGPLAEATSSEGIWNIPFNVLPFWTQGELIWDQTQPAGGELIWEAVWAGGSGNAHCGYRETTVSPALSYMNNSILHSTKAVCTDQTGSHVPDFLADGINYRFFGGPHPLCKVPGTFGCGLTLSQKTQAIVHNFYNFEPIAGWRFTADGNHPLPP